MKGFFQNGLIPAINSNLALAQFFIVIFFFENYSIYFSNSSIIDSKIDLLNIEVKPFVVFFFFIAVTKAAWLLFHFTKSYFVSSIDFSIPSKISFTVFLLCILSGIYCYLIDGKYHSLCPINKEAHPFLYRLFLTIIAMSSFTSGLMALADPKWEENEEQKKIREKYDYPIKR